MSPKERAAELAAMTSNERTAVDAALSREEEMIAPRTPYHLDLDPQGPKSNTSHIQKQPPQNRAAGKPSFHKRTKKWTLVILGIIKGIQKFDRQWNDNS